MNFKSDDNEVGHYNDKGGIKTFPAKDVHGHPTSREMATVYQVSKHHFVVVNSGGNMPMDKQGKPVRITISSVPEPKVVSKDKE